MYNDITGDRFGKLIAIKELSKYPDENLFELSSIKGIPIKIPVVWNSYNTDILCYRKAG